jgi:hypothetical protein
MRSSIFPRALLRHRQLYNVSRRYPSRAFHAAARLEVVKQFLLADIGEGQSVAYILVEHSLIVWQELENARSFNGS